MITRDAKGFCSSSVSSESPMWMTSILKMYLKDLHVRWRHFGFSPEADLRAENVELVSRPGYLGVAYHVAGVMDFDVEIDVPASSVFTIH